MREGKVSLEKAKNRGRQGRLRQPEGGGARVDLHPSRRARGRGSGIRPPAARGNNWIHDLDPRAGVGSPARARAKSRDVDPRPLPRCRIEVRSPAPRERDLGSITSASRPHGKNRSFGRRSPPGCCRGESESEIKIDLARPRDLQDRPRPNCAAACAVDIA